MIFGRLTLLITSESVVKEAKHIFEIDRQNGYTDLIINSLINNRKRALQRQALTTLTLDQQLTRRIALKFNEISLSFKLENPIYQIAVSGIYEIYCIIYGKVYTRQTRKNVETWLGEYLKEAELAEKGSDRLQFEGSGRTYRHK